MDDRNRRTPKAVRIQPLRHVVRALSRRSTSGTGPGAATTDGTLRVPARVPAWVYRVEVEPPAEGVEHQAAPLEVEAQRWFG